MGTPAANQFEAVLSKKFPGIRFGRVNCRKISGSSYWSQHSWNNARDVYPPTGIENEWLDQVYAFIVANKEDLNVRVKLYRVKSHYNHIHIDFWPRGWATPPCAGGSPRYKYPDGGVKSTATLINTYEEQTMNLKALVRAAYKAGNPAVTGNVDYWLALADTNPLSDEWEDLFTAMLTPTTVGSGIQFGDSVRLEAI